MDRKYVSATILSVCGVILAIDAMLLATNQITLAKVLLLPCLALAILAILFAILGGLTKTWLIVSCIPIVILVFLAIIDFDVHQRLTAIAGDLESADLPTPQNPCSAVDNAGDYTILLGENAIKTRLPHTIVEYRGEALLFVRKSVDGGMAVNFQAVDNTGKVFTELVDNHFNDNANNIYHKDNPDLHTLVVFDQNNHEVLRVIYINKTTIRIRGTFYLSRGIPVSLITPGRNCSASDVIDFEFN